MASTQLRDDMTAKCPAGYWLQEDIRRDCYFYCTMPKQDGTAPCHSDEAHEDRALPKDPQGNTIPFATPLTDRKITGEVGENQQFSGMQHIGLVCAHRAITCCQPK